MLAISIQWSARLEKQQASAFNDDNACSTKLQQIETDLCQILVVSAAETVAIVIVAIAIRDVIKREVLHHSKQTTSSSP